MSKFEGVLHFYSETGTEGGWYAFQDAKFMGIPAPDTFRCKECGRVWDKSEQPTEPPPAFSYFDPDSGYYKGYDEPHPELPTSREAGDFNDEMIKASNATSELCYAMGHAGWELMNPGGTWSYEGLHTLNNGDHLVVKHPETGEVVWEGDVNLTVNNDLYKEDSEAHVFGMWVNQEPVGVDRETWARWFLDGYPATLEES